MNCYKALNRQVFDHGGYRIVPIRIEDKFSIMKWRNEQLYHLRQTKPLTETDQIQYFDQIVSKLFDQDEPGQLLFSYLSGNKCIGYGGLVHINWIDSNAEISFIMDTGLEREYFSFHWQTFLRLIAQVAFQDLKLHKIYTYAYDLRPKLYPALLNSGFSQEAVLKDHCQIDNQYLDVLIHSKFNPNWSLRKAVASDCMQTFQWANDPFIRRYAFQSAKIAMQDHEQWFLDKIQSNDCLYLILEVEGQAAGSIRFDFEEDVKAKISYLVDPGFTGKGLGAYIVDTGLNLLRMERPGIKQVYGLVFEGNQHSIKIFDKLGFTRAQKNDGVVKFRIILG